MKWMKRLLGKLWRRARGIDRRTVRDVATAMVLERVDLDSLPELREAIARGLQASGSWDEETERELSRWMKRYEDRKPKPATSVGWCW